jgi:hypothetical protein
MAAFKSICDSLNPLVQRRRQNGEHGALFDELIVRIEYYLVHECLGKYVEDEQKRIGFSDILTKVSKDPVWMRDITDRVYFGTEEDIDSFIKAQLGKLPFGLKAHIVFDLFALKGGLTAPTPRSSDRELEDVQAQVQSVLRLMNDETSLDSVKYDAIAALLKQWKSGQISAADYMQKLVQSVESGQTDASIAQKFIRLALLESGHHAPSDSLEMHIQKTDRHRFVLNEVCFATATMRPHKVNDIDTKCGLSVCDKAKSMLKLVMLPKSLCAEASRLADVNACAYNPDLFWKLKRNTEEMNMEYTLKAGCRKDYQYATASVHRAVSMDLQYPTLVLGESISFIGGIIEIDTVICVDAVGRRDTCHTRSTNGMQQVHYVALVCGKICRGGVDSSTRSRVDGESESDDHNSEDGMTSGSGGEDASRARRRIPSAHMMVKRRFYVLFVNAFRDVAQLVAVASLQDGLTVDQVPTVIKSISPTRAVVGGTGGMLGFVDSVNPAVESKRDPLAIRGQVHVARLQSCYHSLSWDPVRGSASFDPDLNLLNSRPSVLSAGLQVTQCPQSHSIGSSITALDYAGGNVGILISGDSTGTVCMWHLPSSRTSDCEGGCRQCSGVISPSTASTRPAVVNEIHRLQHGRCHLLYKPHKMSYHDPCKSFRTAAACSQGSARVSNPSVPGSVVGFHPSTNDRDFRIHQVFLSPSGQHCLVALWDRFVVIGVNEQSDWGPSLFEKGTVDLTPGMRANYSAEFQGEFIRIWRMTASTKPKTLRKSTNSGASSSAFMNDSESSMSATLSTSSSSLSTADSKLLSILDESQEPVNGVVITTWLHRNMDAFDSRFGFNAQSNRFVQFDEACTGAITASSLPALPHVKRMSNSGCFGGSEDSKAGVGSRIFASALALRQLPAIPALLQLDIHFSHDLPFDGPASDEDDDNCVLSSSKHGSAAFLWPSSLDPRIEQIFLQFLHTLHQNETSESYYTVKHWLACYSAFLEPPSLGLLAAVMDQTEEHTLRMLRSNDLCCLLAVSNDSVCTVTAANDQSRRFLRWLCSSDPCRAGTEFWVDVSVGHNKICALYLRYCGNKSVAIEHAWHSYLTTFGPTHLRRTSRGLRALTFNIRKIDETASIRGTLPRQLGYVCGLQEIYARRVGLTGRLPYELGELAQLRVLSMGNNQLCGELPASLGNLSNLQRIVLHQNRLTGAVPDSLGKLGCIVNLAGNPGLLHGQEVPEVEKQALMDLFNSTQGSGWNVKSHW